MLLKGFAIDTRTRTISAKLGAKREAAPSPRTQLHRCHGSLLIFISFNAAVNQQRVRRSPQTHVFGSISFTPALSDSRPFPPCVIRSLQTNSHCSLSTVSPDGCVAVEISLLCAGRGWCQDNQKDVRNASAMAGLFGGSDSTAASITGLVSFGMQLSNGTRIN